MTTHTPASALDSCASSTPDAVTSSTGIQEITALAALTTGIIGFNETGLRSTLRAISNRARASILLRSAGWSRR